MSLLAFIGLRYPVRMLPVLLFESLWKLIWLSVVTLPVALAGEVDQTLSQIIFNCSFDVVILAVFPWGYVWQRYVMAPGDRWHRPSPQPAVTQAKLVEPQGARPAEPAGRGRGWKPSTHAPAGSVEERNPRPPGRREVGRAGPVSPVSPRGR
jgi:hypothetical protein